MYSAFFAAHVLVLSLKTAARHTHHAQSMHTNMRICWRAECHRSAQCRAGRWGG